MGLVFISNYSNITFDDYINSPNLPWVIDGIVMNSFKKEKQQFIEKKYKEYMSVYRIQQCWDRASSIPTNPICQRRIERDYEKCTGITFC